MVESKIKKSKLRKEGKDEKFRGDFGRVDELL